MHPTGVTGGIIGLIIFILDVIAIFEIINSNRSLTSKVLWSILIILFPILGLLLYFLFGGREEHRGYHVIA
ncbi:hypothetical protein B0O80DRAFT_439904 [Mortierella sp. GBAus27b]|nr:hypothetical protein B0O80DRAFT_439904 [Mortierella sp. GBAus27b]